MQALLPFIIIGLTNGAIYGVSASGFVLSYRTSGIFNFSFGAMAALSIFFFYWLNVNLGLSWQVAFVLSVVVLGPITGLIMELLARRLATKSVAYQIVGTIGVILIVESLMTLKYPEGAYTFPSYAGSGNAFTLDGAAVTWIQVVIFCVGIAATTILYLWLHRTRVGAATRAVVDDPDLLSLVGTSPVRIRRYAWVISSTLAALAGVLVAQGLPLDATFIVLFMLEALGAAAIGQFRSLPLTYLGGALVGVLASLLVHWTVSFSSFNTLPQAAPYIVLALVPLLLSRGRLPQAIRGGQPRRSVPWSAPAPARIAAGVIALVFLSFIPNIVGSSLSAYTDGLTMFILLISLGLLVRVSGQVSLAQIAFAAIGAAAFSWLAASHGWPWGLALIVSSLIVVPVGALLAIPATRLSGVFLALSTLGFGVAVEQLFYNSNLMFGAIVTGKAMPRPSFASSDRSYYYLVLAIAAVCAIVIIMLIEGRLGRLLRSMSDSPTALSTLGVRVGSTRVIVFCVSAFVAGIGGVLYGCLLSRAGAATYPSGMSLTLLAVLALSPFAEPWYALVGAFGLAVVPTFFTSNTSGDATLWLNFIFGVFAIVVAVQGGTMPAPTFIRNFITSLVPGRWRPGVADAWLQDVPVPAAADAERVTQTSRANPGGGLEVENVVVQFGGHKAVSGLSLKAPRGRVTGLIGPNGAGKTTTFNAASGLIRPTSGRMLLDGRDISGVAVPGRARLGLGRTFQTMELFESMTVAQNVGLGREAGIAGRHVVSQIFGSRSQYAEIREAQRAALDLCGIGDIANHSAGELSTGQRRLVELARAVASNSNVLLLDEPSSGLDRAETVQFGAILQRLVSERDIGILLVEHDIELVTSVCGYIYVIDFGELIFEGTPAEVAASEIVQAAYLGEVTDKLTVAAEDVAVVAADAQPGDFDDAVGSAS